MALMRRSGEDVSYHVAQQAKQLINKF